MIRLHPEQLNGKLQFMRDYISAQKRGGRLENGRQRQRYAKKHRHDGSGNHERLFRAD